MYLWWLVETDIQVAEVRLVKDKATGESRGFAFVEFHSTAEASRALQASVGLLIDEAYVITLYLYTLSRSLALSLLLLVDILFVSCHAYVYIYGWM